MARKRVSHAAWLEWLKAIEQDIYGLHADRLYWRETVRIVKSNPHIPEPGYVMDWITRMYVSHIGSGIRRQMEESPRVVSLRRLLASMRSHPSLLTRKAFVKAWCAGDENDDFEARCATSAFDDYAAKGTDHVDRRLIEGDISLLAETGATVKDFVDERVAHYDKAHARADELARLAAPTFKELNDALDLLGTLLKKYYQLLTGNALVSAEPVPQMYWTHPYTVAWMPVEEEE